MFIPPPILGHGQDLDYLFYSEMPAGENEVVQLLRCFNLAFIEMSQDKLDL